MKNKANIFWNPAEITDDNGCVIALLNAYAPPKINRAFYALLTFCPLAVVIAVFYLFLPIFLPHHYHPEWRDFTFHPQSAQNLISLVFFCGAPLYALALVHQLWVNGDLIRHGTRISVRLEQATHNPLLSTNNLVFLNTESQVSVYRQYTMAVSADADISHISAEKTYPAYLGTSRRSWRAALIIIDDSAFHSTGDALKG